MNNDLLTTSEINAILERVGLMSRPEGSIKIERRGRKQVDIVNHWYETFGELENYLELKGWVDDVMQGAARLSTGNSHTTAMMLYHILKTMPFITTSEIKFHINKKRSLLGSNTIESDRYCSFLRSAAVSLIESLDYHTEHSESFTNELANTSFSFNADAWGWRQAQVTMQPQTNSELIRKLELAGLSNSEITNYVNGKRLSD